MPKIQGFSVAEGVTTAGIVVVALDITNSYIAGIISPLTFY
jgi:hypothetical protein